jgi:hypothetical protein
MAPLKLKFWDTLDPKRKQWVLLILLLGAVFTILWAIFVLTEKPKPSLAQGAGVSGQQRVTNVGVMAPGQQVNPLDSWLGGAGKDIAQLKQDRDAILKEKDDQKAFNRDILTKFEQLQQKITQAQQPAAPAPPAVTVPPAVTPSTSPANLPPARSAAQGAAFPPGLPPGLIDPPRVGLTRVSLRDPAAKTTQANAPARASATGSGGGAGEANEAQGKTLDNYIPISFTRGVLLGGLDAPTGGQAQSNPHPVLLRLDDNAILPNRFRAEVRECFVIGAGYGDISSERAYIRTERLSCVRHDGTAPTLTSLRSDTHKSVVSNDPTFVANTSGDPFSGETVAEAAAANDHRVRQAASHAGVSAQQTVGADGLHQKIDTEKTAITDKTVSGAVDVEKGSRQNVEQFKDAKDNVSWWHWLGDQPDDHSAYQQLDKSKGPQSGGESGEW